MAELKKKKKNDMGMYVIMNAVSVNVNNADLIIFSEIRLIYCRSRQNEAFSKQYIG